MNNRGRFLTSRAGFTVARRSWRAILALSGLGISALGVDSGALGATIRADVSDSNYTALSAQAPYAPSGYLTINVGSNEFNLGSATLIAPDWVLTNAGVVTNGTTAYAASAINFGQGTAYQTPGTSAVSNVVLEPGFANSYMGGDDLALLQLSTPITSIAPAALYTNSLGTELSQTATIIGYGFTGTGLTGQNTSTIGTRRGIQNTIDAFGGTNTTGGPPSNLIYSFSGISSNVMLTDFDEPSVPSASVMGSATPLGLEGASVAGDIGGGLFLTIGSGKTYLAGVTDLLGAFDNNPLSTSNDGHYGDFNGYTRLSVSDSTSFIDSALQTSSAWNLTGSGTWASLSSWSSAGIPEFAGASANFTGSATSAATVSLNANWTVGNVIFSNSHGYTITPGSGGTLFLDNGGPTATGTITDSSGKQSISAPLVLNSSAAVTVTNAGDSLTLSGAVSGAGGLSLAGAGTLVLGVSNSYAGATTINSGTLSATALSAIPPTSAVTNKGTVSVLAGTIAAPFVLADITGSGTLSVGNSTTPAYAQLHAGGGASAQSSLNIASNSSLDITNNILTINFPSGADPATTIRGYLTTGYNSDKWTGPGINSSNAAANSGLYAVGYADGARDQGTPAGATQIVIENTLAGDANLDGTVNFADLLAVAQNFNHTLDTHGNAIDWADGDFNYDGVVNFADLLLVAQNFNKKLAAGQLEQLPGSFDADWQLAEAEVQAGESDNVPEPAGIGLLAIAAAGLMRRRRQMTGDMS